MFSCLLEVTLLRFSLFKDEVSRVSNFRHHLFDNFRAPFYSKMGYNMGLFFVLKAVGGLVKRHYRLHQGYCENNCYYELFHFKHF